MMLRVIGKSEYRRPVRDRKSTRLNSSHSQISYAVFCLKKKKITEQSHMTHLILYDSIYELHLFLAPRTIISAYLESNKLCSSSDTRYSEPWYTPRYLR